MHFLMIIDELLSEKECQYFIDMINTDSSTKKIDRGEYGTYNRILWKNKEFADELWNRIQKYLPNDKQYRCLNSMFRIAKYTHGGEFKIHRDGVNQDENGYRTELTLNIFLNKGFEGGETDFFLEDKSLRYSAKPDVGRAALFYFNQYHCGNVVRNGEKYLLRTDVMV